MKSLLTLCVIPLLTITSHAQTQQWGQVFFANHVLTTPPDRLVRGFDGTPVVGTYHATQLYYGTNISNLIPLTNAPATFAPPGTSHPGTWLGGMRTLVGIPPSTRTYMQVRFWHTDAGATFEEASRNDGPCRWFSALFTYVPPPPGSPLEAHYMKTSAEWPPTAAVNPQALQKFSFNPQIRWLKQDRMSSYPLSPPTIAVTFGSSTERTSLRPTCLDLVSSF